MIYTQLFTLMREARLSAEQMGERLGISGMTIRRWKKLPKKDQIPVFYANAAELAIRQLISEGKLSAESNTAKDILSMDQFPFETAATSMGISSEVLENFKRDPKTAVDTLSNIGSQPSMRDHVDKSTTKINSFKKMGEDWAYRITHLVAIMRSKQLHSNEKLVAYGAFFYLLNPFDFIPDAIPAFGLLDDLFLLSVALTFYLKRYPEFFEKKK